MPYLMHVAVDIPFRPDKRISYFEYHGVRFKYIQNDGRRWSDVLVTLLPDFSSPDVDRALRAAGEFASALAWEFDAGISVRHVGGPGKRDSFRLRSARCQVRVFPELPFLGFHRGYSLTRIANIETAAQREALTLYREGLGANKKYLALLLHWQIMEVGGGNAIGFVNRLAKRHPGTLGRIQEDLKALSLGSRTLGDYLSDDFRHAVAHIRRKPGRTKLTFDDDLEAGRISRGARVIREFARQYILRELRLNSYRLLVRHRGKGFPVYLDRETIEKGWYLTAS